MILGLGISTPEIILQKDGATPPSLKGLKEGQSIRAKVLAMTSETKALMLIGGQKVTAETGLPLKPGQELQLRLVREKDQLTFKLIQDTPQPGSGAKPELSLAKLANAFLSFEKLGRDPGPVLGSILEELALKSGDRDDQFLSRLVKNSGLLLEKKIATLLLSTEGEKPGLGMQKMAAQDLKAAVLQLLSGDAEPGQSPSEGKAPGTALAKAVASALDNFQTLTTQTPDTNRFILPFPVLAGDQFNFGQLFMDTGKKGEGKETDPDKQVIRLAFLLDMTSLGSLRADFSILKKSLTGRFLLEDQSTSDYMASLMPELGRRLAGIGYQLGRIDCCVAEPRQLTPGALIQSITSERQVQGLDLVI